MLLCCDVLCCNAGAYCGQKITDFKVVNFDVKINDTNFKIIRKFLNRNETKYFGVNVNSLETVVLNDKDIISAKIIKKENSRFDNALQKYTMQPIKQLNKGINSDKVINTLLTIDLCSSCKYKSILWEDKLLFSWLVSEAKASNTLVPVGIAITAKWINDNKDKLEQLKLWNNKYLKIVWINHSKSHKLNPDEYGKYQFLIAKDSDFKDEVLSNEVTMLENDIIPSVFFRFPGLKYNDELLKSLNDMSLIAIDANAWINKGEKIKNNSVILLHGNGNEHSGVIRFRKEIDELTKKGVKVNWVDLIHNL